MKIQYYDYLLINNWSLAACQSHVSVNVKITGILSQFRYYDVLIVIYKGLWMLHHRILLPNTHTFKIW